MDSATASQVAIGRRAGRFFKRSCLGFFLGLVLYSTSILAIQEDFRVTVLDDCTGSFRTIHLRCFSANDARNTRILSFYWPLLRLLKAVGMRLEVCSSDESHASIPPQTVVYVYNLPEDNAAMLPSVTLVDRLLDYGDRQ